MPYFPQETVDHIVDFILDHPEALRRCCLVSKSWRYRARMRLFNCVSFVTARDFRLWKELFPDSANSPASLSRTLCFRHCEKFTDSKDINWINSFTNVARLEVHVSPLVDYERKQIVILASLRDFPSAAKVKSLTFNWYLLSSQEVFNFIRSFPNLEALYAGGGGFLGNEVGIVSQPSGLPSSTGTFVLHGYASDFVRELLKPQNICNFRKIVQKIDPHRFGSINTGVKDLVEAHSKTLECIRIHGSCPIDLSRAIKLKEAEFRFSLGADSRIATTLNTIVPENGIERISIHLPFPASCFARERGSFHSAWGDLDIALVRLLEVRPHCLKAMWYDTRKGSKMWKTLPREDVKRFLRSMLPKTMKETGGNIEIVLAPYREGLTWFSGSLA